MEIVERFEKNPIIKPTQNYWEAKGTFNPAAFFIEGEFHIFYRAFSEDFISTIGYSKSNDGFNIKKRSLEPIYKPRKEFEKRISNNNFCGCEDPRTTILEDKIYLFYTAYNGIYPRVAFSSIKIKDFLEGKLNWEDPKVISPPLVHDKNACILSEKINGKYIIYHRPNYYSVYVDVVDNLEELGKSKWIWGKEIIKPRENEWDSKRVGICAPPIKTELGWLAFYHGADENNIYRASAVLLDLKDPTKVISRLKYPILEPKEYYEKEGYTSNVVFPTGVIRNKNLLYVYYGAADFYVAAATINLEKLLSEFDFD